MLLLASTADKIQVITSGTANIDVHASYVDLSGTTVTPGRKNSTISTATTTDVVDSPGASTSRTVKTLTIRNRHASTANTITVQHTDGTTVAQITSLSLPAGWEIRYDEGNGFRFYDANGREATNTSSNGSQAAVNSLNLVVLSADVTNNNAVANTIQDVTGLSFNVTAGETYWFRFTIWHTAAATTTGSRFAINGPATSLLGYRTSTTLSAAGTAGTDAFTDVAQAAYDSPTGSNTSSATQTAGQANVVTMEGLITPSANGTVIARFASEVSSSAIVAKAGSLLQWVRTL